jgi:hypothetical protein
MPFLAAIIAVVVIYQFIAFLEALTFFGVAVIALIIGLVCYVLFS